LTRLAGGIFLENRAFSDSLPNLSNEFETIRFKNETRDFWFGHAFKLFGGKNEDYRTTNLVTTIGYKKINYIKTPTVEIDPNRFFANEELYLASIGVNTRKFAEDKYLFNFGIIEDIPFGQVYSITGGFQNKNNQKRAYFGGRFAYGNYFDFGYLGINSEWGSFFEGRDTRETTFKIEANYFTNLIYFGDWKIRQFIKSSIVIGNNRVPILKDRVMLGDDDGIQGFNNPLISGIRKATITLQTQTYVPGSWHGFRFSPFYNMTLGMLGNETDKFLNKSLLSKFSIGVLINNDYLVFNSFQISFSFYPKIPFQGTNIFNTNSYKNNDLSLPCIFSTDSLTVPSV
jgi:hemolysin activation/secretion protein